MAGTPFSPLFLFFFCFGLGQTGGERSFSSCEGRREGQATKTIEDRETRWSTGLNRGKFRPTSLGKSENDERTHGCDRERKQLSCGSIVVAHQRGGRGSSLRRFLGSGTGTKGTPTDGHPCDSRVLFPRSLKHLRNAVSVQLHRISSGSLSPQFHAFDLARGLQV